MNCIGKLVRKRYKGGIAINIRIKEIFRNLVTQVVFQNTIFLFIAQIVGYIIPLLIIPYLTRILSLSEYGLVVFFQSISLWMIIILEYGYNLSATRDVAVHKEDQNKMGIIATEILGAKLLLVFFTFGIISVLILTLSIVRNHPIYALFSFLYAVFQGLIPAWYYQGTEKLKFKVMIDLLSMVISMILIFIFVKHQYDGWKVLAIYAFVASLSSLILYVNMYKHVHFVRPSFKRSLHSIHENFTLFLLRNSSSMLTTANTFILGLICNTEVVGLYSAAEKLVRSILGLLWPMVQAAFPRISHNIYHDFGRVGRLIRLSLFLSLFFAFLFGIGTIIMAPYMIEIIYGKSFMNAVPLLRILSILFPVVGIINVLTLHVMIPLRMDRELYRIYLIGSLLNVIGIFIFVHFLGVIGMSIIVVLSESTILLAISLVLKKKGVFYKLRKIPEKEGK